MNKNKKIRTRFARLLAASIFATTASGALAGQASGLRPPAVPLLAHNPNFSVWSPADRLTDANTWNYRKTDHPLVSLIRVDGKSYRLMGAEPAGTPALEQQSVKVTPTRTTYEFAGAGVHVTLCFMQPMFPDDLEVFSWPLGYLTWQVRSTDGAPHKVQLYQSTSSLLSVEGPQWDMVEWQRLPESELTILRVGMKDRLRPAARGGDNWRYILAAARSGESGSAIGENKVLEQAFISSGELPKNDDSKGPRKAIDAQPVAAFAFDLGKVGAQPMERQVLIGCDERFPLQFMVKNLRPYWARNGGRMEEILQKAARQYPELLKRSEAFDRELTEDLVKVGGAKYAEIAVLSYRQAFAACGLAADAKGLPMFFPKEITSNACISTIDVIFPMSPILLALSPSLAKASLVPVLIYSSSPRWRWPSAPHDLGTYPVAAGLQYRDDGGYGGPGMPVESSASVILMCDAIALADGNADFVAPWWPVLTRWANYLEKVGYDPDKQVCTDDFMGPLAHNVNLSAKSIVALAAYGDLCRRRGDEAGARKYTALARTQAAQWLKAADDGDHYRLAFDLPGTWSQKYNLVWDTLLGLNVFPAEVARKEVACYKTHIERYGVPLDSRTKRTKSDWTLWSAALASDRADFEALIAPYYTYLDTTSHRVPMTDYYETTGE